MQKDLILAALERSQQAIMHMQRTLDQLEAENNHIRRLADRRTLVAYDILERSGKWRT